ncbi:MAG TPA: sulfatase [Candidatus Hydrogenedentes bacterium]|nr:sulfatase [Candidatus Hydrogenedentota bacterium]HIJ74702.1 sulfatase [Candidatus Hydrogenedentota bacterium]
MPRKPPNILVFAIDSIRRDHMSCYGYWRLTTPNMDKLAAGGLLFENAFSAYIPTTPAYVSMLTGRDVIATQQVALQALGPMAKDQPTLPELLKEGGYKSVCVGHGGFYRGFDQYLDYEMWGGGWDARPTRKAESLNEVALPALDRLHKSGKPWLLFLRHMDPHAPYLPPAPFDTMFYSKNPCSRKLADTMKPVFAFKPFADFHASWMPPGIRDKDHVIAQYDGEIAYMDACIQRIITRVEELSVLDSTLVIITGDHGETLYDHEIFFDHHGLYEPTLIVPLIFYWPGKVPAGVRSQAYTLLEDLVPTILDICGLKRLAKGVAFDGKSSKPYFTDTEGTPRSEFYISECTWMRKQGWRTPIWKFWEALEPDFHGKPPVELYNLVEDPEELTNLADTEPQVVHLLRNRMDAWLEKRCRQTGKGNPIELHKIGLERRIGSIGTAQKLQKR